MVDAVGAINEVIKRCQDIGLGPSRSCGLSEEVQINGAQIHDQRGTGEEVNITTDTLIIGDIHQHYYNSRVVGPDSVTKPDVGMIVEFQGCCDTELQSFSKYSVVQESFQQQMMDTSSAQALGEFLLHVNKPLEMLVLHDCRLAGEGARLICQSIDKLSHKVKRLHLSNNSIGNVGVQYLSAIVDKIEALELFQCDITDISPLTAAVEQKKCKLKRLELGGNPIGDLGAEQLSKVIHNLEELNWLGLYGCRITNVAKLSEAIEQNRRKIEYFDLGWNPIGDTGVHSLGAFQHIGLLRLHGCEISEGGKNVIRAKLKQLGLPTNANESLAGQKFDSRLL